MHDPLVVAFEIRRPWPKRMAHPGGQPYRYWPAIVTVWHREPRGRDSGEVCKHYRRWQGIDGEWHVKYLHAWKWHVHHWHLQVRPLQQLRRALLTRCAWCGGRSRKGDVVNYSHSWNGPRGHWWQGEPGLYHGDCSDIATAHRTCTCADPLLDHTGYGRCALCGRFRSYGAEPARLARAQRIRESVPVGKRG
jgi:hypothetical protein